MKYADRKRSKLILKPDKENVWDLTTYYKERINIDKREKTTNREEQLTRCRKSI